MGYCPNPLLGCEKSASGPPLAPPSPRPRHGQLPRNHVIYTPWVCCGVTDVKGSKCDAIGKFDILTGLRV